MAYKPKYATKEERNAAKSAGMKKRWENVSPEQRRALTEPAWGKPGVRRGLHKAVKPSP